MTTTKRVLVVDDMDRWREAVSEILFSRGFEVDTAASLEEARTFLTSTLYHCLVLDIRMEELDPANEDGMALLRELRRSENSHPVSVIVLSAHGNRRQMREAFRELGVTDFLDKKDFDESILLASLQS